VMLVQNALDDLCIFLFLLPGCFLVMSSFIPASFDSTQLNAVDVSVLAFVLPIDLEHQ